jgi:hypothetical protein
MHYTHHAQSLDMRTDAFHSARLPLCSAVKPPHQHRLEQEVAQDMSTVDVPYRASSALAHVASAVAHSFQSNIQPVLRPLLQQVVPYASAETSATVSSADDENGESEVLCVTDHTVIPSSSWQAFLVFAGGLLFAISDVYVARQKFVKHSITNRTVGLCLYFYAQLLFSLSLRY